MKKIIFILYLALISSNSAFSQAVLSAQTKIELSKKKTNPNQRIAEKYISVFIQVESGLSQELITSKGVQINTVVGNIWSVRATLSQIEILAKTPGVLYIEVAPQVHKKIDAAKIDVNVNKANEGFELPTQYTGKGVIIGIIDGGFDFTHPVFKDTSGTKLRIARLWDQTATGNTPTNFQYGAEYTTESEILALEHAGEGSHGTHVASIAGGSGIKIDNKWSHQGVAPDVEFVLVNLDFNNLSSIPEAVDYIYQYAASVSKPVVVNMSLTSPHGPRDGSSSTDQMFDGLVGNGKILVGGAGNEGNNQIHLAKSFSNDTLKAITVLVDSTGNTGLFWSKFNIIGDENEEFKLKIGFTDTNNIAKIEGKFGFISSNNPNLIEDTIIGDGYFAGYGISASKTLNNKSNMTVAIAVSNPLILPKIEIISSKGTVHIWNCGYLNPKIKPAPFFDIDFKLIGDNSSTMGEIGGTGNSVISVGAYTTTNNYTNFDNEVIDFQDGNEIGAIAPFSSKGPTVDGRRKPDITAPGNVISAAVSSYDPTFNVGEESRSNVSHEFTQNGKTYRFAYMQGTSMSSPFVTGVVALMLQANPNLNTDNIKDIFEVSARKDDEIINNPNTWGAGKIDAYSAILKVNSTLGIENSASNLLEGIKVYPNPTSKSVSIDISKDGEYDISIVDLTGKVVIENQKVNGLGNKIALDHLQTGIYSVIIKGQNHVNALKLIVNQ
jgi:subtilisin family serine protease